MKKLKTIFNKIKKYFIIIGSVLLSIIIFILSIIGYKSISKNTLSKKEKKLKDDFDKLKKEEKEVLNDIEEIKDNCDDSYDRFNNSPFNKSRDNK